MHQLVQRAAGEGEAVCRGAVTASDTLQVSKDTLAAVMWRGAMRPAIRPGEAEAWYESRCLSRIRSHANSWYPWLRAAAILSSTSSSCDSPARRYDAAWTTQSGLWLTGCEADRTSEVARTAPSVRKMTCPNGCAWRLRRPTRPPATLKTRRCLVRSLAMAVDTRRGLVTSCRLWRRQCPQGPLR